MTGLLSNVLPDVSVLNSFFLYDKDTGKLFNRFTRSNMALKGKESGWFDKSSNYLRVGSELGKVF